MARAAPRGQAMTPTIALFALFILFVALIHMESRRAFAADDRAIEGLEIDRCHYIEGDVYGSRPTRGPWRGALPSESKRGDTTP